MKAIVYEEYGSAEVLRVLRYTDVENPTVGDDEVLVGLAVADRQKATLSIAVVVSPIDVSCSWV